MSYPPHARLLPWSSPDGKPCYLLSSGDGPLTRRADLIEEAQLSSGETLLEHARDLLPDEQATTPELRFLACCLRDALSATTRVARSRGARLDAYAEGIGSGSPRHEEQGPDAAGQ